MKVVPIWHREASPSSTHLHIDYLMGEADGVPKDPNHIFRLYMALGNFEKAAKTAVIKCLCHTEHANEIKECKI